MTSLSFKVAELQNTTVGSTHQNASTQVQWQHGLQTSCTTCRVTFGKDQLVRHSRALICSLSGVSIQNTSKTCGLTADTESVSELNRQSLFPHLPRANVTSSLLITNSEFCQKKLFLDHCVIMGFVF